MEKNFRLFLAALCFSLAAAGFAAALGPDAITTLLQRSIDEGTIIAIIRDCKLDAAPTADELRALGENGASPALIDALLGADAYGTQSGQPGYYGLHHDGKLVRYSCRAGTCPPEDLVLLTEAAAPAAVRYAYTEPARRRSSMPAILRIPLFVLTTILTTPNVDTSYYDDMAEDLEEDRKRMEEMERLQNSIPEPPPLPPQYDSSFPVGGSYEDIKQWMQDNPRIPERNDNSLAPWR